MTTLESDPQTAMLKNRRNLRQAKGRKKNAQTIEIRKLVQRAGGVLAPVWPLSTFIACNPLQGLENCHFSEALAAGEALFSPSAQDAVAAEVNKELIKWCQAYLDEGQATFQMPYKHKGFFEAWRLLAPYDKKIHKGIKERKDKLQDLPFCPADAIKHCLKKLALPPQKWEDYLRYSLGQLPGWGGYIKWKESEKAGASGLLDFLAARAALTWVLSEEGALRDFQVPDFGCFSEVQLQAISQREERFRKELLRRLSGPAVSSGPEEKASAQLVFCIDVRSESLRRQIESAGPYETFGFAGFFGLPVSVKSHEDNELRSLCPVLLKPAHTLHEQPDNPLPEKMKQRQRGIFVLTKLREFYQSLKYHFSSPFALVETLGPWSGLWMASRTLAPGWSRKTMHAVSRWLVPEISVKPALSSAAQDLGIPFEKRVEYAASALQAMGLTERFSRLVVFCGHRSTTVNNPHASSLDCGACGGNHGGRNGRILAEILNDPEVRKSLESMGILIPDSTLFLGGEHDTTTDQVDLFDHDVAPERKEELGRLKADLMMAGQANCLARWKETGATSSREARDEAAKRSYSWSEVRPEWGLARNAAFIVGPRNLTKGHDLEGRCFLHSYNPDQDEEGSILETILTAPLVVAQWINAQYFFSALDPALYGSGSKITQNVIGKLGVVQGNGSDLMHGLPLQSVYSSDGVAYHEPLRLQTVVTAPRKRVERIIEKHECLQKLFCNEWVGLTVIENGEAFLYQRSGAWQSYASER